MNAPDTLATGGTPLTDVRSEEMLLNMGPQHPSTHGVFRVVIRTDGEIIIDSEAHVDLIDGVLVPALRHGDVNRLGLLARRPR